MRVPRHTRKGERASRRNGAGPDRDGRRQPRDTDVTGQLNELFADPALAREQLLTATELDAAGTDWSDENW